MTLGKASPAFVKISWTYLKELLFDLICGLILGYFFLKGKLY